MPQENWQDPVDAFRRQRDEFDSLEQARVGEPRSWMDRATSFLSGSQPSPPLVETRPPRPRRSLADLMLKAVLAERLDDGAGLGASGVYLDVHDGEVTLNGVVRHQADKDRIEALLDVDGVRGVQNNLHVRSLGRWVFL